jgi:hypothetical protein
MRPAAMSRAPAGFSCLFVLDHIGRMGYRDAIGLAHRGFPGRPEEYADRTGAKP